MAFALPAFLTILSVVAIVNATKVAALSLESRLYKQASTDEVGEEACEKQQKPNGVFIISANLEYKQMDEEVLLELFLEALKLEKKQKGKLVKSEDLWDEVSRGLLALDPPPAVIGLACQECVAGWWGEKYAHQKLARLLKNVYVDDGKYARATTMTKFRFPFPWNMMYTGILVHKELHEDQGFLDSVDTIKSYYSWFTNKGATVVGFAVPSTGQKVSLAGVHFGTDQETKDKNLLQLHDDLLVSHFDDETTDDRIHLLFGDMNYRLLPGKVVHDFEEETEKDHFVAVYTAMLNNESKYTSMYSAFKNIDTVPKNLFTEDGHGHSADHYRFAEFTEDALPTYDLDDKAACRRLADRIHGYLGLNYGNKILNEDFDGCYGKGYRKFKGCQPNQKCMNFGWLDRLVTNGPVTIKSYTTLLPENTGVLSDHAALYALVRW